MAGHRVVGHHAETAVQPFELPGRKRLHDVERTKQQKPKQQSCPTDRNHEQRDQHAHHFIDHDRARIGASQIFFARLGEHDTGDEQRRRSTTARNTGYRERVGPQGTRHAGGRADRAWGERKKTDVPEAADKNR